MISVIIPCYNYGHLIKYTLNSILSQTYTDWEIIVVDDGSTDDTQTVVAEYIINDNRIKYFKILNSGPSAARNYGIRKLRGQFVQFLDADDLIEELKFEKQLDLFNNNPGFDVVYGSVRYFNSNNVTERLYTYWGQNKEWMPKLSGRGDNILQTALKGNFSHPSSPIYRKSIIDKVGYFDEELRIAEDYQYLIRCLLNNAYFHYNDSLRTYSLVRWHDTNASSNVPMMQSEEIKMRKKLMPLLADNVAAVQSNSNAIKSLQYKLGSSWKRHFLSGGKLDFFKKWIKFIGLEKLLIKLFYN